ncbi:MAG: carboxypeptidase-like regulatory domain-containing protein [Bacteroidota bacterium]
MKTVLKWKGLILFLIIILFYSVSFAQKNTAILIGKLTDKNSNPIVDASVSVPGTKYISVTNAQGNYHLVIPADTTITVEFSHISFGIRNKTVQISAGTKKNFDLSVETFHLMDTVVIEDKLTRNNFIQTIPIKNIFVQAGASGDFNVILFTQLGVQQSNELSSVYSVRGGNFDENLVYVNDIEVYRPFLIHSGQQEGLSFVNSDMISSINFSSGGFESRYGDKMSSVLDIRYRKPREFAGNVSGSLLGNSLHLEGASESKRLTWQIGVREKSNQYLLKSLDVKGNYKPLFYDIQSFITYNFTDEWELDLLSNISRNKYRLIPQTRKSSFGTVNQALQLQVYMDGQEVDDYQTFMGGLSTIYRPFGKDLSLKFISSAYRTLENESYDVLSQYYLNELETDFGNDNFGQTSHNIGIGGFLNHARNYLNATVCNFEHKGNKIFNDSPKNKKIPFGGHQIWWGIKYQHEIINDQLNEWTMIDSAGFSLPHSTDSLGYIAPSIQPYQELELNEMLRTKNILETNRYCGYFQHSWSLDTKDTTEISFTAGVRANYWDLNKQILISPRATLAMKPKWKRDVLFKFSSGYYYQPPFYREMRDFNGILHTDLKAQQSIHFVIGNDINFRAWNRPFKFVSEIYYKHLEHLIPYEVDNVRIRYYATNNAKGYATGIDMKVNGEFVKGMDSWMSLSVMKTMEDITDDYYYIRLNSNGDTIIPGYTSNYIPVDSIRVEPGNIPRPMDQRVTFGLFFQDYLPKFPKCKVHLNLLFGSGLPFGPPSFERYKDVLRMPSYRRVDIGFSYEILSENKKLNIPEKNPFSHVKSIWLSLEVFNLLAVNNTISYLWVRDVTGRQYAVPNYLSNRLLNARLIIRF